MKKWIAVFVLALCIGLMYFGHNYLKTVDDGINGPDLSVILFPCQNTIVQSVPSPNGHLKAVVFVRVLREYSTHVSVLDTHEDLPNSPGNTFIAAPVWSSLLGVKNDIPIRVTWTSNNQLQIQYPSQNDVHHLIDIHEQENRVWAQSSFLHGQWITVHFADTEF